MSVEKDQFEANKNEQNKCESMSTKERLMITMYGKT